MLEVGGEQQPPRAKLKVLTGLRLWIGFWASHSTLRLRVSATLITKGSRSMAKDV